MPTCALTPLPASSHSATYLWRGYNFLKPFTSHWQVLAYSDNFFDAATEEPIWLIVSFFVRQA